MLAFCNDSHELFSLTPDGDNPSSHHSSEKEKRKKKDGKKGKYELIFGNENKLKDRSGRLWEEKKKSQIKK